MSKAIKRAKERYWLEPNNIEIQEKYAAYVEGYHQAEKDVAESFARIIRSNLSMIDKSVQDKFEQLYTEITVEKMYKGFID
jgi:hypothetical protein